MDLQVERRGTVGTVDGLCRAGVDARGGQRFAIEVVALTLAEFLRGGEGVGRMDSQGEGAVHRVALTGVLHHVLLVPALVGLVGDGDIVGVGTAVDPSEGGVGVDHPVALRSGDGAFALCQELEAEVRVSVVEVGGEDDGHGTIVHPVVAVGLDVDVGIVAGTAVEDIAVGSDTFIDGEIVVTILAVHHAGEVQHLAGLSGIDGLGHVDVAGVGGFTSDGVGHVEHHAAGLGLVAGQVDDRLAELDLDIADVEVGPGVVLVLTATDSDVTTRGVLDTCKRDVVFVVCRRVERDGLNGDKGGGIHAIGKVTDLERAVVAAAVVGGLEAHLDGVEGEVHLGKDNHAVGTPDVHPVAGDTGGTGSAGPAGGQARAREGLNKRHVGILPG